ncbi:MAG: bifunctional hydroxymethylpyrimidine kinase/phosphomethylpyrimidine kinase [Nitrospirae bacterium]|nr:bifunctional hydroxymethylpyrimidine kinase/phosphomethylpyrimidine kinase [Nitrospirota bacterium]
MKKALTIAGFDPSGGAGIQADLKVFHLFGIYGLSVASSLTAQNTKGVEGILPVSREFVKKQLDVLLSDIIPDATKTGMLYSEYNIELICRVIRKYALQNIVVDPVFISSSGRRLAERGVPEAIRKRLLPFCAVVTPNIYEASVLTGIAIETIKDMEKAAVRLSEYGCRNVIVTGGHLKKAAVDLFYDGEFHYLRSRKIKGEFHGTGCTFSSAVTALLAGGKTASEAAMLAKKFMDRSLKKTFGTGRGMRLFDLKYDTP